MPNYNYYCKKCNTNHSDLRSFEDRNKTSTCPECKKSRCPLTYDDSLTVGVKAEVAIKGGSTPKFYKSVGNRKTMEKRWLEQAVKNTDDATKFETGASPYTRMDIDHEYWAKQGVAKKVSAKEARQRKKNLRKQNQAAGKNIAKEHVERMTKGNAEAVRKGKD
jgi:putative FmdB family regulatory protein